MTSGSALLPRFCFADDAGSEGHRWMFLRLAFARTRACSSCLYQGSAWRSGPHLRGEASIPAPGAMHRTLFGGRVPGGPNAAQPERRLVSDSICRVPGWVLQAGCRRQALESLGFPALKPNFWSLSHFYAGKQREFCRPRCRVPWNRYTPSGAFILEPDAAPSRFGPDQNFSLCHIIFCCDPGGKCYLTVAIQLARVALIELKAPPRPPRTAGSFY